MKPAFRIGWILLCLALALAARCWNLRDVFVEGRIYFVDADCYSRMTRARMVDDHPGTVVRHHDFENWPEGVIPHTTAPLDYLIVGLKAVLEVGLAIFDAGRTSVLRGQMLDLAGALISPLLGMAGALFLALWLWKLRVRYWEPALLFFAVSPILVHGTLLGRPDHQALLIFLLTIALGAEAALVALVAQENGAARRRGCGILSGLAWSLSLWVSLYEPLILLVAVLGFWLAWQRRALWVRERLPGALLFVAVLAVALAVEGWRIAAPDAATRSAFAHWQRTVGELAHLDLRSPLLFGWLGWMVIAAPVLLFLTARQDRRAALLLVLLGATFALTLWQIRWGYFLALVFMWTLPWQLVVLRRRWVAWLAFGASLWPLARDWDARLFPDAAEERRRFVLRTEQTALREIGERQRQRGAGPFVAPWWLSPALAYWSGQPGVAGSSHESLPGIVDTARIYLAPSAQEAEPILRARRVAWILSDAPDRVVPTSAAVLGVTPPVKCLAIELAGRVEAPDFASSIIPESGIPRPFSNDFFQVWRVQPAAAPANMPPQ